MLHETIKKDLQKAKLNKDSEKNRCLMIVMGELARIDTKKLIPDERVINLLNKMIEDAKTVKDNAFIEILQTYLPKQIDEKEIIDWIKENIDFSKLSNKMQAVGIIKKHFGVLVDGKMVNNIVKNF